MKCFGLIGNPLGHSFSPLIHKHLFGIKNIDASYKLLETTPENFKKRIGRYLSAVLQRCQLCEVQQDFRYDSYRLPGV